MILDRLLMTIGLTLLNGAVLNEPMRANEQETNFTLYNGTQYDLLFQNAYNDNEYIVPAGKKAAINNTYHSSNDWAVFMKEDWDNADALWYECIDSIGQPSEPEWHYSNEEWTSYFIVQGVISTATGIGVYKDEWISNDQDYFIDPLTWGGLNKVKNDIPLQFNLLDVFNGNCTCRLYKENGTYYTINQLNMKQTNVENNPLWATALVATVGSFGYNVANNFNFTQSQVNYMPAPTSDQGLQPYLMFYNNFTNRVRFYNTAMPKSAEENPNTGYAPLTYFTKQDRGYITYSEQGNNEATYALTAGFTFAYMAFSAIAPLFGYIIFPGISIGLLLCIPLIISLLYSVIKLIKKG